MMKSLPVITADLLQREVLAFSESLTVGEAADSFRRTAARSPKTVEEAGYLYVTGPSGGLAGVIEMRDLILHPDSTRLGDIMKTDLVRLEETAPLSQAARLFRRHGYLALPVVDPKGRLLGALALSRMAPLMERQAGEALYQATGIGVEELSHRSTLKMLLLRSPWLLLSILSGLAASFILGNYFVGIESIISLILFIPIVLGLAGSVSRQAAVLIAHEFSQEALTLAKLVRILFKESLLAAFAGLLTLVSVGIMALLLNKSLILALAIGSSISLAILVSGFLGAFLPFLFVGLRLDPKIAQGPIAVALCDLLALWVYLKVAFVFLSSRGAP